MAEYPTELRPPKVKQFSLKRETYAAQQTVSDRIVSDMGLDLVFDYVQEDLYHIFRVKFRPFSEHLVFDTVKYPKDWWQAFKERWFPAWLKLRYPIEYNSYKIDLRALYTKVSVPPSQHTYYGVVLNDESIPPIVRENYY